MFSTSEIGAVLPRLEVVTESLETELVFLVLSVAISIESGLEHLLPMQSFSLVLNPFATAIQS